MSDQEVGTRIRKLREAHNYTRDELAEKLHISAKFLYEIESGRKGFSAKTLSLMAKEFSVSCDYIMFGEKSKRKSKNDIFFILEKMEPKQASRMRHIIKLLNDLSSSW